MKHASELANRCAGIARGLSYNEKKEADIKFTLREASYFIDSQICRVHKKRDGLMVITARGHARYMTWRERVAYWLLGGRLEIRPNHQCIETVIREQFQSDTAIAAQRKEG